MIKESGVYLQYCYEYRYKIIVLKEHSAVTEKSTRSPEVLIVNDTLRIRL